MNRRKMLVGTGLAFVGLAAGSHNPALACPPARHKIGQLVEHKSGYRLYVMASVYRHRRWQYDLGIQNKVLVQGVPECELSKVD